MIYTPDVYAVQSWAEGENSYRIRYYGKEGNVTSVYHSRELFEQVLKLIDV
jgi:hypothetical protein